MFMSDNGANPKEPHFYFPNTEEQIERDFDNSLDNMGRMGSFVSIGGAWAEVANTPLSYFKTTTYEGGTQVPLIVAGRGVKRRGIATDQLLHVTDVFPTLLDITGATRPDTYRGDTLEPLYGTSWYDWLSGGDRPIRGEEDVIGFEIMECRAVIKGGWKLIFIAPPYGNNDWALYNLNDDPREMNDVAKQQPDKVAELKADWENYAQSVGYIKANDKPQLALMTPEQFFKFEKS
jgi:arylsulfatase